MLGRWRGCHVFHQCSHHLSFLTCLAFLPLTKSRISHISTMMNSQMINSMGTHMRHSVSTTGIHRSIILRSRQGSRTLVQRFTLQRQIHRFRQLCFAHTSGGRILRRISQGLLLRNVQHVSLHTPTSPDAPASTVVPMMSDWFSFFLLFSFWYLRPKGEKFRGINFFSLLRCALCPDLVRFESR